MQRRNFLAALSALLPAGAGLAQTHSDIPKCVADKTIVDGVSAWSSLRQGERQAGETYLVGDGYGSLRLAILYYPSARYDAEPTSARRFDLLLTAPRGRGRPEIRLLPGGLVCQTTSCDPQENLQIRYTLDDQHLGRVRTTPALVRSIPIDQRGLLLSRDQEDALRAGRSLWFEIAARTGWERAGLNIRNLDGWIRQAEQFHRDRLRFAAAQGRVCGRPDIAVTPACYMSTRCLRWLVAPLTRLRFEV